MAIAYVKSSRRGGTDLLLASVAETLQARGIEVCGVVQINTACDDNARCDMDVRMLPDGPLIRISQSLGPGAQGCRLDVPALETAVGEVKARLHDATPLLIVNKFGKHEADGRGFRDVIADAVLRGVPVIVGLNAMNEAAFQDFAEGLAQNIAPDHDTILDWFKQSQADR